MISDSPILAYAIIGRNPMILTEINTVLSLLLTGHKRWLRCNSLAEPTSLQVFNCFFFFS